MPPIWGRAVARVEFERWALVTAQKIIHVMYVGRTPAILRAMTLFPASETVLGMSSILIQTLHGGCGLEAGVGIRCPAQS
ncbi:hypothetical protein EVAR_99030_1 [Eumeta japonica]|uniref:Uncharacterized protein n=1 Tax=Eumeta variegata TaxID=151549 RepID=A0A4C2AC96_EUMVA|nr:hypothetical protein EVAR_99030_1 [Eumeta japonica]